MLRTPAPFIGALGFTVGTGDASTRQDSIPYGHVATRRSLDNGTVDSGQFRTIGSRSNWFIDRNAKMHSHNSLGTLLLSANGGIILVTLALVMAPFFEAQFSKSSLTETWTSKYIETAKSESSPEVLRNLISGCASYVQASANLNEALRSTETSLLSDWVR